MKLEQRVGGKLATLPTFHVHQGQLFDNTGKAFIMRGVNNPHAYFRSHAYHALETIKAYGFNTVRVVCR